MTYRSRPPTGRIPGQLNHLEKLGMIIPDREHATHYLRHIGYHRLSNYWQSFQVQSTRSGGYVFQEGVAFGDIIAYYTFDGYLRSTLTEALGQIEVSARALWASRLAGRGGERAHMNPNLFTGQEYRKNLPELEQGYQRVAERGSPDWKDATIWEVTEAMSFGQLSKWYGTISDRQTRRAIAKYYDINPRILLSILRNLAHLRNICAHHGRLWNRSLRTGLVIPNALAAYCNPEANDGLYNRLVITAYLMDIIEKWGFWKSELVDLMESYPTIAKDRMGFPDNWGAMDFWRPRPPTQ